MRLHVYGYKCIGCDRLLKRSECIQTNDPMDPFGPGMLCPFCDDYTLPWTHKYIMASCVLLAIVLGGLFGMLLIR
jgi:hypothetical protein